MKCIATNLYGSSGNGNQISNLYSIDKETGVGTLIGTIRVVTTTGTLPVTVNGMAFDRNTRLTGGTMFAHTSPQSALFPNYLIAIDLTTAIATLIGPSATLGIAGMAINNIGDIYSFATRLGNSVVIDDLVKFNKATGQATVFPMDSRVTLGSPLRFGMSFDRDIPDTLHVVNGNIHYILNLSTGVALIKGTISNTYFGTTIASGFGSLDPDSSGLRFWAAREIGSDVDINTDIVIYNLDTRTIEKIMVTNIDNLQTLAFAFETTEMPSGIPSPIPSSTPSVVPTRTPSVEPTSQPSTTPSLAPSAFPSVSPSRHPSRAPTVSPMPSVSTSPSQAPTVADPCQRNQCSLLFGFVTSGREVRFELFGYCKSKCVFPIFAAAAQLVGWQCGGC